MSFFKGETFINLATGFGESQARVTTNVFVDNKWNQDKN